MPAELPLKIGIEKFITIKPGKIVQLSLTLNIQMEVPHFYVRRRHNYAPA